MNLQVIILFAVLLIYVLWLINSLRKRLEAQIFSAVYNSKRQLETEIREINGRLHLTEMETEKLFKIVKPQRATECWTCGDSINNDTGFCSDHCYKTFKGPS